MFSTKERLRKRTGKNKVDRPAFLKRLVEEYSATKCQDAKHQVLANLGNFAYDPINYCWLRNLNVIRLFLEELNNSDAKIVEYAIGGLCNLALDLENKSLILSSPGSLSAIVGCLAAPGQEIPASALTLLIFLITPKSKSGEQIESLSRARVLWSLWRPCRGTQIRDFLIWPKCFWLTTVAKMKWLLLRDVCRRSWTLGATFSPSLCLRKAVSTSRERSSDVTEERRVSREDIATFARLTGDSNPVHLEGRARAHGALLNGYVSGLIGTRLPGSGSLVVEQTLNFAGPCYADDVIVIHVVSEPVRKITLVRFRVSRKDDDATLMTGTARIRMTQLGD